MIISDAHRFVFVHIPKCAGTSVRKALRPIDDTVGIFDRIGPHPQLGMINYGHLTLPDLANYFPEAFAKISEFRSMAIVRDPVDRFFSALAQRLREFKGYSQSQITPAVIEQESLALARNLESTTGRLDLEFVHFNRQSDYIFNDGARVVDEIFALDRLSDASAYIEACTGVRLAVDTRENRTTELRIPALQPLVRACRAPYVALLPLGVRNLIRSGMIGAGLYGSVKKRGLLKPGSYVDGFLRTYYGRDFELFAVADAA